MTILFDALQKLEYGAEKRDWSTDFTADECAALLDHIHSIEARVPLPPLTFDEATKLLAPLVAGVSPAQEYVAESAFPEIADSISTGTF